MMDLGSTFLDTQIYSSLQRLWAQLNPHRKKQVALLFVIMVIASFAELLSIGAVLPFLGVLMSPEKIFSSPYAEPLVSSLKLTEPKELLLPLTILFVAAVTFAAGMRFALLWGQTRLSHAIGADLSCQIYEKTLYQAYSIHIARNSSEIIAGITGKVNSVVNSTLLPILSAIGAASILVVALLACIAIDIFIVLITLGGFGVLYALITISSRRRLAQNSQSISRESNRSVKALQEGLGGIRDILIDGTQVFYCKLFRSADFPLRNAQANNQIIAAAPRYLIEALGIALIAMLAYILTDSDGHVSDAIPLLGAFAIGAQRLLPVMHQLYASFSTLRGGHISLRDVLVLLEQPVLPDAKAPIIKLPPFKKSIRLNSISFRYTDQTPWVLRDITFQISKGARIGIRGATGSGKSTLLDILTALLRPTKGSLIIDGTTVTEQNFRNWQSHLAQVPQAIFLADSTISENIAFGLPVERIDRELIQIVAQQAQIAETIESWENGYDTLVGERGVRLSGGQRQRIGIARALYKRADVIVFDEATSALDNETERDIIETIKNLSNDLTIIMIAHRLSTLRYCDQIIELSNGSIKKIESYSELIENAS